MSRRDTATEFMQQPTTSGSSTRNAGVTIDDGRGRVFPCEQCGAELTFHIGQQKLACPHCGHTRELHVDPTAKISERDLDGMLKQVATWRQDGVSDEQATSEVRCAACGGTVVFTGNLTSSECPYCGVPLQRENIHTSPKRIPVDGVLPFLIERNTAAEKFRTWVNSRWFAPNDFRKSGEEGKFNGVYLPYWTFDAWTSNVYYGLRGDEYYVTVGEGNEQRQEIRVNWTPVSGSFERFFDDVISFAAKGLPHWMMLALEPWRLDKCVPFNQELLAGFLARTYDIPLDQGFNDARTRMDATLHAEAQGLIGGNQQQLQSVQSNYQALTYKHLLLPVWLLAYRFQGRAFQVAVNASTGEVQGERPYSAWKITAAVIAGLIAAGVLFLLFGSR